MMATFPPAAAIAFEMVRPIPRFPPVWDKGGYVVRGKGAERKYHNKSL